MHSCWFNTRELYEFADSLVAELVERFPPAGGVAGKKAFDKLRRTFGATFERIDAFARSHKLNVYKKAHFANQVRWALPEAGSGGARRHRVAREEERLDVPGTAEAAGFPARDPAAVHRVGLRRPDLRIDLEPLPQAVPRPRRLRADAGARDLHGRHGARRLAGEPAVGAADRPASRLCPDRGADRHRLARFPPPVSRGDGLRLRAGDSHARLAGGGAALPVDPRRAPDSAPAGAA